ncbi:MAG: phosphatase PAP2 family protein [Amnibacterium sp.]
MGAGDVPDPSPRLVATARLLDRAGGGAPNAITLSALVLLAFRLGGRRRGIATGVVALAAIPLVPAVKRIAGRARPDEQLVAVPPGTFPSGHATSAALLAVGTARLVRRRDAWPVAIAWMAAMDASRTLLRVHWLSDVLAGSLLGTSLALLAEALAA